MRTLIVLLGLAFLLAACGGDRGTEAGPPAELVELAREEIEDLANEPSVITADAAGYRTAQEALTALIEEAGASEEACAEHEESGIAAERSLPHGLTPLDPLPVEALDRLAEKGFDPADYELRVLTETAIVFVTRDPPTTHPDFRGGAWLVEQFVLTSQPRQTGWIAHEGGFWYDC